MLEKLQGNILKGHGRKATALVLLRFDEERPDEARRFLAALGPRLTSARRQFDEAALYRQAVSRGEPPRTPPFLSCMLSSSGYEALGWALQPDDYGFRQGMKMRGGHLSDPNPAGWERPYRDAVHGLVMVGGDRESGESFECPQVDGVIADLQALASMHGVEFPGVERGRVYENGNGHCMEHFGFIDGRSQPLFTQVDIETERSERGGTARWDPAYPLEHVVVRDPGVDDPNAFGSYFVYRKLEQNVRQFNRAVANLASALEQERQPDQSPVSRDRIEAMIVGRFRDGRPLVGDSSSTGDVPANDFNYDDDIDGLVCPLNAHIRKSNPRGSAASLNRETLTAERTHFFARRAIPYGYRRMDEGCFTDEPESGVGLLFLSCHADIRNQFEHIQRRWANRKHFPRHAAGIDLVIGVPDPRFRCNDNGAGNLVPSTNAGDFQGVVSLKGGEYFFAPSLPFFRKLT